MQLKLKLVSSATGLDGLLLLVKKRFELIQKRGDCGSPRGILLQKLSECAIDPLYKALTLFITNIYYIPYPIYELTLKSKLCFRPTLQFPLSVAVNAICEFKELLLIFRYSTFL